MHARHNVINTNVKYSKHFKPLGGNSFGRKVEIPIWLHLRLEVIGSTPILLGSSSAISKNSEL
jgi:hypothetical protein